MIENDHEVALPPLETQTSQEDQDHRTLIQGQASDSNTVNVVTKSVSMGFWEAKYLQTKCNHFLCTLDAEGCEVQLPVLSSPQRQGRVNLVLTGLPEATGQAGVKITNHCSLILVQSITLNCSTKYLSIWIQRWKEFIKEQSKINSSVLIDYQQKQQSGNSQVIEFNIVGVDSAAVAKTKCDLVQRENGSKQKLAKLDITLTNEQFVVLSNHLKEFEAMLNQSQSTSVIVELDSSKKCVQLVTAPNKNPVLYALRPDVLNFIATKTPTAPKRMTKEIKFKDKVIGTLLTSKTKYLSMIEQEGNALSVDVQPGPDQSQPNEHILRLTGNGVQVRAVELTIKSIVERLKANVAHAQLVVGGHSISITSMDSFKNLCAQMLKELHVHCMYYPPVGGDLLRQVHLKSKTGHILTLQIAVGHLSDERVDAIVVSAESRDKTMTNVEMRFEYFKCFGPKSLAVEEVACIDSGSFPSNKALHVSLPKRHEQVEKQASVDFIAACIKNTLDCASSNRFGSLSFPALGMDGVHNVSIFNTLLDCVDKYCEEKNTTLHTIRIVITKELSSAFLSCFDEHHFEASHQCDLSSSSAVCKIASYPPRYEWYWEDDRKQFTQYSQTVSDTLSTVKLENPNKRCYISIDGKTYLVDLSTMTQINFSTGYVRKVMCKKVSSVGRAKTESSKVQWYYRDDSKNFAAYSQASSDKIEGMYQKVSGAGMYLHIHSRIYKFDFENMKQVNISTKYQRDIKRLETPIKERTAAEQGTEVSQCVINLRGPEENLQLAKQMVKEKLESLSASKNVPLPPTSTPALKQKLFSIARRHSVSSSIRDERKPKSSGASNQRFSQVIRIEGAEHLVDKAVTEVQGEIIEFQSTASAAQADTQYPAEWEAQTSTIQLFMLDALSREWIRITSKFRESMPDTESDIISVQRIQNKWLWERYSQHKVRMYEKNDGVVNEKELWHGSRLSSSDNIYDSEEGFDMRFSLQGLWGQANYFAEMASYSDHYAFKSTDGTKEILIAKVLTGDSFESKSDSSLRMPPEKPSSRKTGNVQLKQLRYDSVTGITRNCRVYMTYTNDKAYPAYLIRYRIRQEPSYRVPLPPTQPQRFMARFPAQVRGYTQ